ncbi:related to hexose transporter protein [Phialocephala subalpina]|uniref:Related to hexose transporter protein n=1 Tax=Phialocephala subalpina TaxID=576137 RepID=A0A1L7XNA2_9HELO|nr:related to hexose transporter protein [Phialocephala subalpina]
MAPQYSRQYVSRFVPNSGFLILFFIIATSVVDSVLLGYDSSLMGSLNVMPSYYNYFELSTATKSLNTAISYTGGAIAAFPAGFLVDWRGRRESIFWSCVITLIGAILQTSSVHIAMFILGRFILGMGMGVAATATPTYVAETAPPKHRAFALGLYYSCWGVGTLIASGVCYRSQFVTTTWAWRIPSLIQVVPSIACMFVILFVPESPRWLIGQDRHEEALEVLAVVNAGGDVSDPTVLVQYREIADTIAWEKTEGRQLTFTEAYTNPANRKRLIIAISFSAMVMLPGTNIITYYFGTMLEQAGITNATTQLEINIILTAWSLVIAVVASFYADKVGRKLLCCLSLTGGIISFYLVGGLTAAYGTSSNKSGIYGTIACIFLYNGTYSFGITPLTVLYPPEVLSYRIRGTGMGLYTMSTKLCGLFVTMVFPFALDAIGWKTYIINASFDILMVLFVMFYWVETQGLTLEEVDVKFDGVKHSSVPDLEELKSGKVDIDIEGVPLEGHLSRTVTVQLKKE